MSEEAVETSKTVESDQIELLRACRGCLATETDLYDLHEKGLAQIFGEFTGIAVFPSDGYPQFACTICLALLRKFFKFRLRCHTAMWTLQQIRLTDTHITTNAVKSVERKHIKHNFVKFEPPNIDIVDENDDTTLLEQVDKTNKIDDEFNSSDDENLIKGRKRSKKNIKDEKVNETQIDRIEMVDVNIKQENYDSDDSFKLYIADDLPTDSEEEKLKDIIKKEEESKVKKRKRRETKVTKPKITRKRGRAKKTESDLGEDLTEIGDDWKRIVDEINEEVTSNKVTKRKIPAIADIHFQTKKATKFADAYNVEVKFLSKEEQKMEIEEKRCSEKFKKAPYKCEMCCKVFVCEDTYRTHAVAHDPNTGDFACEICHYRFNTRLRFMKHFYNLHTKKISCKECGLISREWTTAKNHYNWHKGEHLIIISCEHCDMQFTSRKKYLMHVRNTHGGGAGGPQCVLCDRAFINERGLKVHMEKTHKNKAQCTVCGGILDSADTLAAHKDMPEPCRQGTSPCPKCGTNFDNISFMREHYDAEHRKNYFKCEQCNRAFKEIDKFTSHTNYHNWKSYTEKVGLPRNGGLRSNKEKRKFVCEVCGKEKNCLAVLRIHQRTHTDERPYQCHVCQKAFRQQPDLKIHITTHTDERRFKCPVCQKGFRQYAHRAAHLLTHTKERPFACSACPKRYTSASALKDHTNTAHLGLPPRKWGRRKEQTT